MAQFCPVAFRSIPSFSFRATVLQDSQFTTLALVNRSNWHEYKLEIVDFNSYGPSGVSLPAEIVSTMLKKALELVAAGRQVELGPDTPLIDAELAEHGVIMVTLKGQVFAFTLEFKFPLSPVEVDKFAVLEAQLHDVREAAAGQRKRFEKDLERLTNENVVLKEVTQRLTNDSQRLTNENAALKQQLATVKRTNPFFSLSADGNTAVNNSVVWNGASPRNVPAELIALAADNKTVTIVRPGLYHVYVRILTYDASRLDKVEPCLRVNGKEMSFCPRNGSSHCNGTEVTELLPLRANDRLEVYAIYPGRYSSPENIAVNSRFWGLFMSDI